MPTSSTIRIVLAGHLTRASLEFELDRASASFSSTLEPVPLVLDCREMTGYDPDARALFVSWNVAHRSEIERVAILTKNTIFEMVVAAIAVASGQRMKAFSTLSEAVDWLDAHR